MNIFGTTMTRRECVDWINGYIDLNGRRIGDTITHKNNNGLPLCLWNYSLNKKGFTSKITTCVFKTYSPDGYSEKIIPCVSINWN